jgi:carboxymethylenebutenolidase
MTELQRYLAEEIAEDHLDGLISRREVLRRLGLLGLSVTATLSLIASFAAEHAAAAAVILRREGFQNRVFMLRLDIRG